MKFNLIPASPTDKSVISNLMQFYIYDFSEFIDFDVEEDGLFGAYPGLEDYWKDGNDRFPYIIKQDEKYAGFALVRFIQSGNQNYFSIAEFFIMKKYRRKKIGSAVAMELFDLHKGPWEVHQKESNKPARLFWKKIIYEYAGGRFTERLENGRWIQDFISGDHQI